MGERECAFEPDAMDIRCIECEKPTGRMGTCTDVDFCASCKEEFIEGATYDGTTRVNAEARFSAMLISMIEGAPYKAKYAKSRVLHLACDGMPVCGARGGPHPITTNRDESNCKRCVKAAATEGSKRT